MCGESCSSITAVERKRLNNISRHVNDEGNWQERKKGRARTKPKDVDMSIVECRVLSVERATMADQKVRGCT